MVKISIVLYFSSKYCIKSYDNLTGTLFSLERLQCIDNIFIQDVQVVIQLTWSVHSHFTVCVPHSQTVTIYLACDSKQLITVLYTDTVLEVLDKLSDRLASSESVLWVVDNQGRGENFTGHILVDVLSMLFIYYLCMKGMNSSQIKCHRKHFIT